MRKQIVNIVNFIRGCEPRVEMDLVTPVKEQIRLMKDLGLRGTFLIQYDAMLMPEFTDLLKGLDPAQFELGVWHEIVEPQVKACGMTWTGRFPWDWHVHCGFSLGYTKEQREILVDALFEKFHETFGYYPRVFGSWIYDSHTVRHITEKYEIDVLCNCKEQYGTDGYTLWGGYYNQAYYPNKNNVFLPAGSEENQIPVPLFRMLGPDPIYQYDHGIHVTEGSDDIQGVVTLEPVYVDESQGGGGIPAWTDWYLKENFNGECLSFGYAQAGQENSFGWPDMRSGLEYQFPEFARLQKEGRLTVETLGESGRWFKENYRVTPASAITAHGAFNDPEKDTVWYSSRKYRINLHGDAGAMHIRDLHLFSDLVADPYEDTICTENEAAYESLPVIDGNRNTGNGVLAGLWFTDMDGQAFAYDRMTFREVAENTAEVTFGELTAVLEEEGCCFTRNSSAGMMSESAEKTVETAGANGKDFRITCRIGQAGNHLAEIVSEEEKRLVLEYKGVRYGLELIKGRFDGLTAVSEDGKLEVKIF